MRLNENRNTTPTKADPQTFRTKASPVGLRRWCKDNNDYTRQYASSRGRTARVHTQARSIVEFQICCCTGSVRCPGRASARRYRVLRRWLADHHHERLSDLAGINLAQVCPNRPAGREWVLARQASLICIRPFQRGYAVKGHFPRITTTTKPKAVSEHMHRDLCTRVPERHDVSLRSVPKPQGCSARCKVLDPTECAHRAILATLAPCLVPPASIVHVLDETRPGLGLFQSSHKAKLASRNGPCDVFTSSWHLIRMDAEVCQVLTTKTRHQLHVGHKNRQQPRCWPSCPSPSVQRGDPE